VDFGQSVGKKSIKKRINRFISRVIIPRINILDARKGEIPWAIKKDRRLRE
jgi:hypothetical protein